MLDSKYSAPKDSIAVQLYLTGSKTSNFTRMNYRFTVQEQTKCKPTLVIPTQNIETNLKLPAHYQIPSIFYPYYFTPSIEHKQK